MRQQRVALVSYPAGGADAKHGVIDRALLRGRGTRRTGPLRRRARQVASVFRCIRGRPGDAVAHSTPDVPIGAVFGVLRHDRAYVTAHTKLARVVTQKARGKL